MRRPNHSHGDIVQPDLVDELMDLMGPTIERVLGQLEPGEFTTTEFIQFLQTVPEANAIYREALHRWGEKDEHMSKMVIHGQVIPGVLRRSPHVEWAGFAHGEPDPYAVPAWWKIRQP
jgi:hypothetical protein